MNWFTSALQCFAQSKCPEGSNRDYQQGAYFLSISLRITSTAWDGYEVTSKERASFISPKAQNPQFVWSAKSWARFLIGWRHNRGTSGQIIWLEREPESDHRRLSLVSSRTTFKLELGHSLVVWWLGFYASAAGSMVQSLLGEQDPAYHTVQPQKKKKEREEKKESVPVTLLWLNNNNNLSSLLPTMGLSFLICTMGRFEEWGQVRGRRLLHPKFPQEPPRSASYNLPPHSPSTTKTSICGNHVTLNTQRIWIHTGQEKMVVVPSPQTVGTSQSREEVEQRREVKRRERKAKDWKIMKGRRGERQNKKDKFLYTATWWEIGIQ